MTKLKIEAAEISHEAAGTLVRKAIEAGRKRNLAVAVAVVDNGGNLKAFERDDGCAFLPAEIACDKAWTAVSFGYPTHSWNELIADKNIAPLVSHPRLTAVGGGYPVKLGGQIVGGIGVSGGNYADDMEIAQQALREAGFSE